MSICFEQVTKTFGSRVVLNQVSFEVSTGGILFILGRSGVGKSVTLKHIVGLMKPNSGHVYIDGKDVAPLVGNPLAEIRRKCGMVFQHPALLDSLSIYENVAFGLRTLPIPRNQPPLSEEEIRKTVIEKLALVNLSEDILNQTPSEVSYGMQKRVSLARTLAPQPSYLLFDEPTTGLDPITTTAVNDLIQGLSHKLQVTSIVVSHDMACALKIADRILILDQGKVLIHGMVDEIKESHEPLIREFLSETLGFYSQEKSREVQI